MVHRRRHRVYGANYQGNDNQRNPPGGRHDSAQHLLSVRQSRGRCGADVRPVGRYQEHGEGRAQTQNDGAHRLDVVRQPRNSAQHRVESLYGDVLRHCPHLRPGHGHALKLGVGLLRRREHGVLDHLGGDLALGGQFPHLAGGHPHIVRDGLGDHGGLLQHGVELLAPQSVRGKALGELHQRRLGGRAVCTRDGKLLLDLFGEGNQLIGVPERIACRHTQLGDEVRHVGIRPPAPHGRLVNLLLGRRRPLRAAGHELQSGIDAGELVGGVHQPADGLHSCKRTQQVPDTVCHRIHGGSGCFLLLLLKPERGGLRPRTRGSRVHGRRLRSGGGLCAPGSVLHLFCRSLRLLHLLDILRNCAGELVYQCQGLPNLCHALTPVSSCR